MEIGRRTPALELSGGAREQEGIDIAPCFMVRQHLCEQSAVHGSAVGARKEIGEREGALPSGHRAILARFRKAQPHSLHVKRVYWAAERRSSAQVRPGRHGPSLMPRG